MLFDIFEDNLILDTLSYNLTSAQVSQLNFWGFHKDGQTGKYKLFSNIESILKKVTHYFDIEGIPYSLSVTCDDYLTKIKQKEEIFEEIKLQAKKYKEGNLNSRYLDEFLAFVRNRKNIPRQLKEHQIKAALHLYLIRNGANFSVPGSGKTAAVLTVYEKLKNEKKVDTLFVIGPPACFGPWRTEFKLTIGREPTFKILAGGEQTQRKLEYYCLPSSQAELYLITYQTLLNDQNELIAFLTQFERNVFLVIDEAHYIKQIGGSWASAVFNIVKYVEFRCILTGTPMPRSYTDLFNIFDFLWPDIVPIDSETRINIQIEEQRGNASAIRDILKAKVGSLFYRVRKSELGLKPPIFHPPILLKMNRYEKQIYCAIENRIKDYAEKDYLQNIELVTRLWRGRIMRLRQCVSNVKLLLTAIESYSEKIITENSELARIITEYDLLEKPAKLEYLAKFVGEMQQKGQKLIIWSHFIGSLKLIVEHLRKIGFRCGLIYGDTPIQQTPFLQEKTREEIRDEFIDIKSGLDILVANPAACGESISLHKTCFHAVYYDLSYNCAQYLQSLDRIHRVGGSEYNQANYYFLQYNDSIDQDIKANLDTKARMMSEVIDEDYSIYSLDMTEQDEDVDAYKRLFATRDNSI